MVILRKTEGNTFNLMQQFRLAQLGISTFCIMYPKLPYKKLKGVFVACMEDCGDQAEYLERLCRVFLLLDQKSFHAVQHK